MNFSVIVVRNGAVKAALIGLGACATVSTAAGAVRFPLEWNAHYDTSVPYEVELSREKLAKLVGTRTDCGFDIRAKTETGVEKIDVRLLPARDDKAVRLRFSVPKGTVKLGCEVSGRAKVTDPEKLPDNLFAGATADAKRWQTSSRMTVGQHQEGGLLFSANDWGGCEAKMEVQVPSALAGKGVVFEAVTENVGLDPAGRTIRLAQYDATGRELAESVVDRRWTSHMCPPGFRIHYLEEGRFHPQAVKVSVILSMSASARKHDMHGIELAKSDSTDRKRLSRHRLMRLSLRPAAMLPFPKYDDSFFTAGVSGEKDDFALALGGVNEKAFWYQTRSSASWSDNRQLRDESLVFFPSGEGTVEAWFKSTWKPVRRADGKGDARSRDYTIFQSYQGFSNKRSRSCWGVGSVVLLSYAPDPGRLTLFFREPSGKDKWTCRKDLKLPENAWCHVAMQWTPRNEAEVFVDGRRVMTLAIPNWIGCDLKDESVKVPNDDNAQEFFLGCSSQSVKLKDAVQPEWPLVEGAVDLFRASTGRRYQDGFTPPKKLAVDAATRALFTFDRSFDGTSGGGVAYIPGTIRALSDRVDHRLAAEGRMVQYWPEKPLEENDPWHVFDIVNYPELPTPAEFEALRRPFSRTSVLKPGGTMSVDAPKGVITDYIEIENVSAEPLVLPTLLNRGDVDARSFGDIADSLGMEGLSPRERVDKVFQFVLSSEDYFHIHSAMFPVGSDRPCDVEYSAFTMINGYCGFECGPLNHLTANLFAAVARCPSSMTGGYCHLFEQVFYDGKNHIYDLSAQKFFPAWDNETAAYLKEADDQPGLINRYAMRSDIFIRMGSRGSSLFSLQDAAKVGVTLNPGERFRVWQVNDGNCNDLITDPKVGVRRGGQVPWRRDMDAETHADTAKQTIQRVQRYFPHYLNGFLTFEGRPDVSNPAFAASGADAFTYVVKSGYPITWATYGATKKDGTAAAIELSTDGGKTFRPFVSPATYAVRARFGYLVKVLAPIGDVASFSARTEVQLNPRVFPGRLHDGKNVYTLKAVSGGRAKVTVAGRVATKRLSVAGRAAYSGTVKGVERLFTAFDSTKERTLALGGLSSAATVTAQGNVVATLVGDKLTLRAKDPSVVAFGALVVRDGGAEKEIAVLTGPGVRFATADDAVVTGPHASIREADETSPQRRVWFSSDCRDGSAAAFRLDPLAEGKYAVFNLNRFVSHPEANAAVDLRMTWTGQEGGSCGCGSPRNDSCNFMKANYGRPGERANFKWDYPRHEGYAGLFSGARVLELPALDEIKLFS